MLSIPRPQKEHLKEYVDLVLLAIKGRMLKNSSTYFDNNVFSDQLLEEILSAEPENMMDINTKVMGLLIPDYDPDKFEEFLKIRSKSTQSDSDKNFLEEHSVYNAYQDVPKLFDYNAIISRNKKNSYYLAAKIGRNTCTYCNRLYTNTITGIGAPPRPEQQPQLPIVKHVARAQFDHWFSKSRYPLLALSYYNLIPSCGICNQIKSDKNFQLDTHFHPYAENQLERFTFNYRHQDLKTLNVKIDSATSRIAANIKELKIEEAYDVHSPLELRDLLDLRYKYPDNYISKLLKSTLPDLPLSPSEAKRLIFGIEEDPKNYHQRPFSKFKNDILGRLENE
ncbi:hypothetical protein [Pedobacter rhizosphaerae]|uniref:HNH endonuclease n=1 Tax=Pedobacter rhizosphaerae TaxID=390241 RepID=A0A1H9T1C6_9SPHI|nr:hypothetical protein [Pedobacter rhizosphaerae]SER90931.1 hypothetical protein SAMN04488023_12043 [Pedobacter rhizosphaerae]